MTQFVNNDVSSGNVIFASDHNTQGSLIAAVLNGGIDNDNIATGAAISGSKLADGSVTDDKWRNGVAFHAYRNASRNVGGSFITIQHDTERYDLGSNFDVANGVFTAPVAGVYHFDTAINYDATSNTRVVMTINCSVQGEYRVVDIEGASGADMRYVSGSLDIKLDASEEVNIRGLCTSTTNVASQFTWFSGHLVTRT